MTTFKFKNFVRYAFLLLAVISPVSHASANVGEYDTVPGTQNMNLSVEGHPLITLSDTGTSSATINAPATFVAPTTFKQTVVFNQPVGIGTGNPLAPFHIVTGGNEDILFRGQMSATSGTSIGSVNDANNAWQPIEIDGSTTILGMAGNVGVGTIAPGTKLQVNGQIIAGQGTPNCNSSVGGYSFVGDGCYDTGMFSPSDGVLELLANGVNAFNINGGNVGIGAGNTSPQNALDVLGNIRGNAEIISSNPGVGGANIRMIGGNLGTMWRNDGANFYLLFTPPGNVGGQWSGARPFTVNPSNDFITMDGQLAVVSADPNNHDEVNLSSNQVWNSNPNQSNLFINALAADNSTVYIGGNNATENFNIPKGSFCLNGSCVTSLIGGTAASLNTNIQNIVTADLNVHCGTGQVLTGITNGSANCSPSPGCSANQMLGTDGGGNIACLNAPPAVNGNPLYVQFHTAYSAGEYNALVYQGMANLAGTGDYNAWDQDIKNEWAYCQITGDTDSHIMDTMTNVGCLDAMCFGTFSAYPLFAETNGTCYEGSTNPACVSHAQATIVCEYSH